MPMMWWRCVSLPMACDVWLKLSSGSSPSRLPSLRRYHCAPRPSRIISMAPGASSTFLVCAIGGLQLVSRRRTAPFCRGRWSPPRESCARRARSEVPNADTLLRGGLRLVGQRNLILNVAHTFDGARQITRTSFLLRRAHEAAQLHHAFAHFDVHITVRRKLRTLQAVFDSGSNHRVSHRTIG